MVLKQLELSNFNVNYFNLNVRSKNVIKVEIKSFFPVVKTLIFTCSNKDHLLDPGNKY